MELTAKQVEHLKGYIKGLELRIEMKKEELEEERNRTNTDGEYIHSLKERIFDLEDELKECKSYLD